jgi:hypothetical protein
MGGSTTSTPQNIADIADLAEPQTVHMKNLKAATHILPTELSG